jgi:hypothetical protein
MSRRRRRRPRTQLQTDCLHDYHYCRTLVIFTISYIDILYGIFDTSKYRQVGGGGGASLNAHM